MRAIVNNGRIKGVVDGFSSTETAPLPADFDQTRLKDYVFHEGQVTDSLDGHKTVRTGEFNHLREVALNAGLEYSTDTEVFTVQTRAGDQLNLIALRVEAKEAEAAGETGAVLEFRSQENETHLLTPAELIALCDAALAHIKQIYRTSWTLKDQVTSATTLTELRGVIWDGLEETEEPAA